MNLIAGLLGTLVRLVLIILGGVAVLCLLCIGLAAALLAVIWAVITGRKPAAWTTFMRFRQASQQFSGKSWRSGGAWQASAKWPGNAPGSKPGDAPSDAGPIAGENTGARKGGALGSADVVDVEFKEIPKDPKDRWSP